MKPKQLLASTAFLRSALPIAIVVAITSSDVCVPRTFSSSGITLAGEKKCMPTTSAGRAVAEAIASMSSVDVLVASTQPGLHAASSAAITACFTSRVSKAASTATSASRTLASSYDVVVPMRPMLDSTCSLVRRPFLAVAS